MVAGKGYRFALHHIVVRQGKGDKDRRTMLPQIVVPELRDHLARVHESHERDLALGLGRVRLPNAWARNFQEVECDWP